MNVDHVISSIEKSHNNKSSLTREVLQVKSLSGTKTRHLINNLCSYKDKSLSYFEIGCYCGSTMCSALYKNNIRAVGVDTWAVYEGDHKHSKILCEENAEIYADKSKIRFLTGSFDSINKTTLGKFNIFHFDVEKSNTFGENVLKYYNKNFKDKFVYIRNDWNDETVSKQTFKDIESMEYKILFKNEVFTSTPFDSKWRNGVAIFLLEK